MTEKDFLHPVTVYNQYLMGNNKSISCINYNQNTDILAVARKRTIELWNCKHFPHKECQIVDIPIDSLEAIVWCNDTLFSAGLNGFLYQYSFDSLEITEKFSISGGPAHCLASSPNGKYIAAGTETGNISIFEVNSGFISFLTFFKQNTRILSLAWHYESNILVAGGMSEVYVLDITARTVRTVRIDMDDSSNEVSIHAIELLDDFTIVAGDSRGYVSFVDCVLGTHILVSESHNRPVLCLQKVEGDKAVYATGNDSSVIKFMMHSDQEKSSEWLKNRMGGCGKTSLHSMSYDYKRDLLYASGEDGYVHQMYPTPMGKLYIESFPVTPPSEHMSVAKEAKCLFLGTNRQIKMYGMSSLSATLSGSTKMQLKIRINLPPRSLLQCVCISANAEYLAYVNSGILFMHRASYDGSTGAVTSCKVNLDADLQHYNYNQLKFLRKNRMLAAKNNTIQVIKVGKEGEEHRASVKKTLTIPEGAVRMMIPSDDGENFAVTTSTSDVYVFSGKKYEFDRLPNRGVLPTAAAFHVANRTLCVAYSDCTFVEFDIEHKKYTPFYCQFKNSQNESRLRTLKFPFRSVSYNNNNCILLQTVFDLIKVNKEDWNGILGWVTILDRSVLRRHLLLHSHLTHREAVLLAVTQEDIDSHAPCGLKRKYFSYGSV